MPSNVTALNPGETPPVRLLNEEESPALVYFSSVSENTRRFIDKLDMPAVRIPLRPRREGQIRVSRPFVLIVPTYGGGERSGAVPKQVIQFLNDPVNRALLRGVIPSGNTNFGPYYCLAGPVISAKCQVPELYRFELLGTSRDVNRVREGLGEFWEYRARVEAEESGLHLPGPATSTTTQLKETA
ncbi:class Ib ribonucleoside-diphosphate reductase assembly flavoprotein NrdI [Dermabacteraceae bacterium TAE3-ERU27]|nr:class Ib ribonucleoside-diphosphate reductase assembly flavoprotein NrdI [Dermabacteraceae bacterium TAE3-ERU27]